MADNLGKHEHVQVRMMLVWGFTSSGNCVTVESLE